MPFEFLITTNSKKGIFYEKWVWMVELHGNKFSEAKFITEYLSFLYHIFIRDNLEVLWLLSTIKFSLWIICYTSTIKSGWYDRPLDATIQLSCKKPVFLFSDKTDMLLKKWGKTQQLRMGINTNKMVKFHVRVIYPNEEFYFYNKYLRICK